MVYLAQPPLYRIDIGKETYWALDEPDRDRILKEKAKGNAKPNIMRFKGLGEMQAEDLKATTLDPKHRARLRVTIANELETDRVINDLLGKDVSGALQVHHGARRRGRRRGAGRLSGVELRWVRPSDALRDAAGARPALAGAPGAARASAGRDRLPVRGGEPAPDRPRRGARSSAASCSIPRAPDTGRLFQMAVEPARQGQRPGQRGWSAALERKWPRRGFRTVTLHARDTAVGFYARLGYVVVRRALRRGGHPPSEHAPRSSARPHLAAEGPLVPETPAVAND